MEKISIKVVIAGRNYPLTILADEEGKIRKAAEIINTSIKQLQENYAVKDMQDLLAMTALQLATKEKVTSIDKEGLSSDESQKVLSRLKNLSEQLDVV